MSLRGLSVKSVSHMSLAAHVYPQRNDKAERTVHTVKAILKKSVLGSW